MARGVQYLHASQVQVRGHMRKRVWDSKDRKDDTGAPVKESRIEFVVTEIMLLARPKAAGDGPEAGTTYTAAEDSDLGPGEDGELPF